jgi:hypothetical protein
MKVLVYSHFFAPSVGGVETMVLSLARSLADLRDSSGAPQFERKRVVPPRICHLLYANLLLVPMLYTSLSVCPNYVVNTYLWLLIGILFRLPQLALDGESSRLAEALVDGRRR